MICITSYGFPMKTVSSVISSWINFWFLLFLFLILLFLYFYVYEILTGVVRSLTSYVLRLPEDVILLEIIDSGSTSADPLFICTGN